MHLFDRYQTFFFLSFFSTVSTVFVTKNSTFFSTVSEKTVEKNVEKISHISWFFMNIFSENWYPKRNAMTEIVSNTLFQKVNPIKMYTPYRKFRLRRQSNQSLLYNNYRYYTPCYCRRGWYTRWRVARRAKKLVYKSLSIGKKVSHHKVLRRRRRKF